MQPISNVDKLVLILRRRLETRAGAPDARKRERVATSKTPLEAVHAVAALDDVDDRQLKRALVQGVLAESFGQGFVNDANFQQLVDQVTDALDKDPDLGGLMQRVASDLRVAART